MKILQFYEFRKQLQRRNWRKLISKPKPTTRLQVFHPVCVASAMKLATQKHAAMLPVVILIPVKSKISIQNIKPTSNFNYWTVSEFSNQITDAEEYYFVKLLFHLEPMLSFFLLCYGSCNSFQIYQNTNNNEMCKKESRNVLLILCILRTQTIVKTC